MKILIGVYMILGAYAADFLHEWRQHDGREWLGFAGAHVVFFGLAGLPVWIRRRREGAVPPDARSWLALTFGMYVLGLGLMWFYSSRS